MLLSLQLWHCSNIAQHSSDCPSHPSVYQHSTNGPRNPSVLHIRDQRSGGSIRSSMGPRGLSPVQLYWGHWGCATPEHAQGSARQPWVSVPSPGHVAGCGCCRTRASMGGSWIGPQAGLFVPPWRCGEESPAVPVLAGTITRHCVGSLCCGQRLSS